MDHETRLRIVEQKQITMDAASNTSSGNWRDVWYGVIAVATLLLSASSILVNLAYGHHAP